MKQKFKKHYFTKKILALSCLLFLTPAFAYNIEAAQTAATSNASCKQVANFYWEVGDANGLIISGNTGSNAPSPTTPVYIDSASKWIWGAYVLQKRGGLSGLLPGNDGGYENSDISYLQMGNGYITSPGYNCTYLSTISSCYSQLGATPQTASDIKKFYYSGGEFLAQANNILELGSLNPAGLTKEVSSYLPGVNFKYVAPNPAASISIDSNDYAQFLRDILRNTLVIHDALGVDSWCTNTGYSGNAIKGKTYYCPTAAYAPPLPDNMYFSYSLGHWVETDPQSKADGGISGDGSFSSPGASGFYPWIDVTKTYYGIINPSTTTSLIPSNMLDYQNAVLCGQAIRTAFLKN